jgi:alkanesulfonate monooxygenase SsuD/methylene tetrahydromethanopterin reductase-like flavin-dependent oxidoreductase (luciferase family)
MPNDITATRITHPWVAQGRDKIRFAVGSSFADWAERLAFTQMAEDLGFDACWAYDHPTRIADCWTTLAALAVTTKKIRLISLVSCIYYRSTMLLARHAADVDRLSGGRLILGIGVGDDTEEFEQLHIPFPSIKDRQQALEETIQVVQGLWRTTPYTYHGQHVQVSNARVLHGPVQQPHVPLLIAGGGERVTLRQVAQFADMSNFGAHEWTGSAFQLEDVQRKCAALRRHCDAVGRPYDGVLRSYYSPLLVLAETPAALQAKWSTVRLNPKEHYTPFIGTPEQAIAYYQSLADAGIQYVLAAVSRNDTETVRLLAERVIPGLRPASG